MRMSRLTWLRGAALAAGISLLAVSGSAAAAEPTDIDTAMSVAKLLQSARAVIGAEQMKINDPSVGNKGLTADVVEKTAIDNFVQAGGTDPRQADKNTRYGRLTAALLQSVRDVMDENQPTINKQGVGFKGFIPAVFGRLVSERFNELVGKEADMKVTAPPELVRNRKARPDAWEAEIIRTKLTAASWTKGDPFSTEAPRNNRQALRVLVPEYYTEGCLSCHGEPKGQMDVTGYPMEGAKLGDLGGVISIALFR